MSRLLIFLLGPPRIELDGETVQLGDRKAVALLAYVACVDAAQSYNREQLATLFWPDSPPKRLRANLRGKISHLRKILGEQWFEDDKTTFGLQSTADMWVNIVRFSECLTACQHHNHSENDVCEACLPLLQEAVGLFQDDFLVRLSLKGSEEFDNSRQAQTSRYHQRFLDAVRRLVESSLDKAYSMKPSIAFYAGSNRSLGKSYLIDG